jgi:hypothetical protein
MDRRFKHTVDLLGAASVLSLTLPNEQQARIRQGTLHFNCTFRSIPMDVLKSEVHMMEHFKSLSLQVKDGNVLLWGNSPVISRTSPIAELPYLRSSLDIDALQDSERNGFLHEAEVLKHVPIDRAELLAVFRHVPIEMISQMRYLAERRIILYTISREPRRSQTRVYDMAVVQDTANREIHMIPHRTQCRSVTLK